MSVAPKSAPTMSATPATPMSMPSRPTGPNRSAPPVASAIAAPTNGTPAISRPASELEMCCSAEPSATHGMAISTAAKATTQRHRPRTWRRSVRTSAIGSRMAAAMTVRPRTSVGGRDLGHRDPDEQVRDAPDDRHEGEQDQRAATHDGVRSRSSISQAWSITWCATRRMRNWIGQVRAGFPSAL